MDGNKDEALRCIRIAEEAIASGDKQRAMKFVQIAQRLNHNLSLDELLTACEKLGAGDSRPNVCSTDEKQVDDEWRMPGLEKFADGLRGERNYTEEHVEIIRQIKRNKEYYAILGVDKSCSVDEIRKAYRKLSLKVHPDKNKAPGSEEAFKKVCKAFKCLSDDDSRRQYDHVGLVDDFKFNQRHNVRPRRRRAHHDFFDDDIDPEEIFKSFFGQADMFRTASVNRTRGMRSQPREELHEPGVNFVFLLQMLPFFFIFLLAYLPYSEPEYSLHRNPNYQIPRVTDKHGIEFYVKSSSFDQKFPLDSSARADVEDNVIKDYRNLLWRYCHVELQKRSWNKNLPTPHCNKLENLGPA